MGFIIPTNAKTKINAQSRKTASLTYDECISQLRSKCGYAALVLARLRTLGVITTDDATISITFDDVIIKSDDDTLDVLRGMDKLNRI